MAKYSVTTKKINEKKNHVCVSREMSGCVRMLTGNWCSKPHKYVNVIVFILMNVSIVGPCVFLFLYLTLTLIFLFSNLFSPYK